jgi:hypothetical protein
MTDINKQEKNNKPHDGGTVFLDKFKLQFEEQNKQKQQKVDNIMLRVHSLCYKLCIPWSMTYEELIDMRNELLETEYEIMRARRISVYPRPTYLKEYVDKVNEKLEEFIPEWYKTSKIKMSTDEEINGYKLEDTTRIDGLWFAYDYFLKLEKLYNEPNVITEDEFYEKYDEQACSDWSKQDEHGECFGGFWKYPEGSHEKENAWYLSRKANGNALFKLPYSHSLIFETIEYGCGTRQESVAFSNFMCEYVKRMIELKPPDAPIFVEKEKPQILIQFESQFKIGLIQPTFDVKYPTTMIISDDEMNNKFKKTLSELSATEKHSNDS